MGRPLHWSQGRTHGAGEQRLLHPLHGRRLQEKRVLFSITVRQHPQLRDLIEAIPEADWNCHLPPSLTVWATSPDRQPGVFAPLYGKITGPSRIRPSSHHRSTLTIAYW